MRFLAQAYIIFLLLPVFAFGQQAVFTLYTTKDGLAGFKTSHVTQDQQGLIWFINDGKLHRYDGRNFLQYPVPPLDLASSTESFLGIWPYQDTLFLVESAKNHFSLNPLTGSWAPFRPTIDDRDSLSLFPLSGQGNDADIQTGPGQVKVALMDNRFFILDKNNDPLLPHPTNRHLDAGPLLLKKFIIKDNGSIWACGPTGFNLVYYDAPRDTLFNYFEELKRLLPIAFYFDGFKGIFQDKSGTTWFESELGLLKVSRSGYPFDVYFTDENHSMLNPSLTEAESGTIFLQFPSGTAMIPPEQNQEYGPYDFHELPVDLLEKGDTVWQWDGRFLDAGTGKIVEVPGAIDYNDHPQFVSLMAEDKEGRKWWVFNETLYLLEKGKGSFRWKAACSLLVEEQLCDAYVLHAGQSSGKLWIGCKEKLLVYSPETKGLQALEPKDLGFSFALINAIEEDRDGDLWLGTDVGLVHYAPYGGVIDHYRFEDGLSNDFVFTILPEGDSCLWLSTSHGLSRLSVADKTFINFYQKDGLPHNAFNPLACVKARSGRMYFGNQQNVVAFYPEEIMQAYHHKKKAGRPVLSSFEYVDERRDSLIRQNHFSVPPSIHLYYWARSLNFEYVFPDYHDPANIHYSYKLDGYEDNWSTPARFNFTRFISLPSGRYTLRVKARDHQGVWHPEELRVHLVVHPPWWATGWAYVMYLILGSGIAYGIFLFFKNRWAIQNQLKLEQQKALRLKELDEFKSRFYTNITHEFRTPLTVILGMARQVEKEPRKHLREGLQLIHRNGSNLLRLINQMLDLSKLENNAFQLQLQQGDIVPYLRFLTESFQTYAYEKGLSLHFSSPFDSLSMDFDAEQIKQVMSNLLSNALKFTPAGGEVDVSLKSKGAQLSIEVSDNGIGISEKDLPHIFDRFYQVTCATTRQGEGTGIGLAHTQELLKLMGGDISATSELGKGTSFLIRLPIRRNIRTIAPPIELAGKEGWVGSLPVPKTATTNKEENRALPKLLIVEDNPDVVVYLRTCLEGQYAVDIADDGKTGIEKAFEHIPDLIISDVMMPEKDGFELCHTLKNDLRTRHIPIILLTAKADAASRLEGLGTGADAYLSKPFLQEELLIRLEKLLELRRKLQERYAGSVKGNNPQGIEPTLEDLFLRKVQELVLAHLSEAVFSNLQLAKRMHLSESQLFRKIKALTGRSTAVYIRSIRLQKAKELLESSRFTVSEVAFQVGFNSPSYFSRVFSKEFGIPPKSLRS